VQLNFDRRVVLQTLRMKERLLVNPDDAVALKFFAVLNDWKTKQGRV
jgi:hypothetical protein